MSPLRHEGAVVADQGTAEEADPDEAVASAAGGAGGEAGAAGEVASDSTEEYPLPTPGAEQPAIRFDLVELDGELAVGASGHFLLDEPGVTVTWHDPERGKMCEGNPCPVSALAEAGRYVNIMVVRHAATELDKSGAWVSELAALPAEVSLAAE